MGLERLLDGYGKFVRGRRVGLVAHPASVTSRLEHATSVIHRAGGILKALFGPEHGVGGEAQDMETVTVSHSPVETVKTYSLYGASIASLSPTRDSLDDLDVVVIDLQDIGSRYYTFVWTALLVARACASAGVECVVLDRPNPLGGLIEEGPPQRPEEKSFVGWECVPVRHALTLGEMVYWFGREQSHDGLTVIPMQGWSRSMRWPDTALPWVAPSPNMPTVDTAMVYPGGCLIEATDLSEARGTTRPFELFGAPSLDSSFLSRAINSDGGPGLTARPCTFRPMFHKHSSLTCHGVQIHITNPEVFLPFRAYLSALVALRQHNYFSWRTEPYEFVSDRPAIDLLTGDSAFRLGIDSGATTNDLLALGQDSTRDWASLRSDRWLYR